MDDLLGAAAAAASRYVASLDDRAVVPSAGALMGLGLLGGSLPEGPTDPAAVLSQLDRQAGPATIASAGGRYFGFVTGGTLPAALAAGWLAGAWDQNGAFAVMSPAASRLEEIAAGWVLELLGLPADCGVGFTTGATMGNLTALAAARHALLARQGWDVEAEGLFGAPPLTVVVGEEVHVSLLKALAVLGLGRERVVRVPADDQGRLRLDALPALDDRTILCTQAGNVNTGACDPIGPLSEVARAAGAWTHVDGAFGLWMAASPARGPGRGRGGGGRLVVDRRAQVAQRVVRQRLLHRAGCLGAARRHGRVGGRLPPGRRQPRARAPRAGDVPPGPRDRGVGGHSLARSLRRRRPGRSLLPSRLPLRRGPRARRATRS